MGLRRAPAGGHTANRLAAALDDALDLLKGFSTAGEPVIDASETPASLLEQCLHLCAQQESQAPDPVRTIHHFACTGGTLISKCLAAMPNIQLLSEVDPLSTLLDRPGLPRFAPTDIITQLRQSTRGVSPELVVELFLSNLETVYAETVAVGGRLILRDHPHSHFCSGAEIATRSTFREIVASRFPVLSAVTVRHPLDSFQSLKKNAWISFFPPNLDEYCARYHAFLDRYEGVPRVKYEDLISSPSNAMKTLCRNLDVPFSAQFTEVFSVFSLTGDSGRSGDVISERPPTPAEAELLLEANTSAKYRDLLARLDYN